MTLRSAILALLLCAAHAQARTLYVSLTGSHDTNAPAFSTWATAATNIQAAIDAADAGDTVRVAPGTYTAAVTINKNDLTVQGGRGTLWDADRTIIDRRGAASSIGVNFSGATNSSVVGLTIMGATMYGVSMSTGNGNSLKNCIVRHNVAYRPIDATGNSIVGCIVVGNTSLQHEVYKAAVRGFAFCNSTIIEANASNNSTPFSIRNGGTVINSIYANAYNVINGGGNITNLTFTDNGAFSVLTNYNISPASKGVGSNLVWAGVAAYIPRIGSLAQGAGVGYVGIDTAKSGAGGPALVTSPSFLGRDVSTNRNHGAAFGGVTASTNSPFAGERSAAFDGASGYLDMGNGYNIGTNDLTLECWFKLNATASDSTFAGKSYYGSLSGRYAAFFIPPSSIRFLVQYGGTSKHVDSIGWTPETGKWEHVAATWERDAGLTLYLNGASNAFTAAVNYDDLAISQPFLVGVYHTMRLYLDGSLSDVRIWNVARTPAEIAASYTNRLTGTEAGLVGYWPLKDPAINPIDTGPFNLDNPIIHPTYMEAF